MKFDTTAHLRPGDQVISLVAPVVYGVFDSVTPTVAKAIIDGQRLGRIIVKRDGVQLPYTVVPMEMIKR